MRRLHLALPDFATLRDDIALATGTASKSHRRGNLGHDVCLVFLLYPPDAAKLGAEPGNENTSLRGHGHARALLMSLGPPLSAARRCPRDHHKGLVSGDKHPVLL